MSSLELRGLAVAYGRRQALAPFSDLVHSGEWLGLIGPNGAGKSSLLRAVVGGHGAAAPSSSPTCRSRRRSPTT